MKSVAFFNNKGGVGKTSLVYHLGWSFADAGLQVLLVDLDPQSNLTAMCLDEDRVETIWRDDGGSRSIRQAIAPIVKGTGDIEACSPEALDTRLALVPGDIRLSEFEAELSDAWPRCLDRREAAFRVTSSFYRVLAAAAQEHEAALVLIDIGPNLGAINRTALLCADYVVTPLGADLFSIQGLRNLGPVLARWRDEWTDRRKRNPVQELTLPPGTMEPAGYIVMQPNMYAGKVTRAYDRWLKEVPEVYRREVRRIASSRAESRAVTVQEDAWCLGVLPHYRSLMPMAQSARKPIFHLATADGAIGSHFQAAQRVGREFRELSQQLKKRIELRDD